VEEALAGLDTSPILPWHDEGSWAADPSSPLWWTTTSIGAAERTVTEVWSRLGVEVRGHYRSGTWVDAHGRWRAGQAGPLNARIGPAQRWRRAQPWARRSGRFLPGLPGVLQYLEDQDDPSLTTGDRLARASSAVVLESGGAFVGGAAGVKVGAIAGAAAGTAVPVVGTAVGAVVGAVVGGLIGSGVGAELGNTAKDNLRGAIGSAGRRIDPVIDAVTDVGGSVVSSVRSWFGQR
jgi:hypothetical protein